MNTNSRALSDETLSAFLDGELPAVAMAAVREQLASEPALAERLTQLALVDRLVRAQATALDTMPMPAKVLELLGANAATSSNVVALPLRPRWKKMELPLALAAALVLAMGLWRGLFTPVNPQAPLAPYVSALESAPSGTELKVGKGRFISNFTYRNQDQRWCRQFRWQLGQQQSDNIACRGNDGWQLEHSVQSAVSEENSYQPATRATALDHWLDTDMQGPALDAVTEAQLLQQHWQR